MGAGWPYMGARWPSMTVIRPHMGILNSFISSTRRKREGVEAPGWPTKEALPVDPEGHVVARQRLPVFAGHAARCAEWHSAPALLPPAAYFPREPGAFPFGLQTPPWHRPSCPQLCSMPQHPRARTTSPLIPQRAISDQAAWPAHADRPLAPQRRCQPYRPFRCVGGRAGVRGTGLQSPSARWPACWECSYGCFEAGRMLGIVRTGGVPRKTRATAACCELRWQHAKSVASGYCHYRHCSQGQISQHHRDALEVLFRRRRSPVGLHLHLYEAIS